MSAPCYFFFLLLAATRDRLPVPAAFFVAGRARRAVDLEVPPVFAARFAWTFPLVFFAGETLAPDDLVREPALLEGAADLPVGFSAAVFLAFGALVAGVPAVGLFAGDDPVAGADLPSIGGAAVVVASGRGGLAGGAVGAAPVLAASVGRAAAGAPGDTFFFGRPPFRAARAAAIMASNSRLASAISCACGVRRSRAFSFSTL